MHSAGVVDAYLTANSEQDVESDNGWQDCKDNFGMVVSDCRPKGQYQNWAREAECYHNGNPPEPLKWKNPNDLIRERKEDIINMC